MKLSTAISSSILIHRAFSASASEETGADKATYGGFEDHLKDEKKRLRRLQAGEETFIVTFANDDGDAKEKAQGLAKAFGGSVKYVYDKVLNGAALTVPNAAVAAALAKSPHVKSVEADGTAYASAVGSWGLDRINQCVLPLDSTETKADGTGVKMYIIDTGLRADHVEFTGRIDSSCSWKATSYQSWDDGNGHGTHVGSTACGTTYGVANGCTMCAVKVLGDDGSGSYSDVIAGVNWAASNCEGNKCVANMSLGGGIYSALDTAVNNAVGAGLVFAVAAGNSNANACNYSPARAVNAITVGSSTSTDGVSSFTNYGSCVDVYAPGSSITAAWSTSNSATNTISGTSMATPHVAGVAAGMLNNNIAAANVPTEIKNTYKTQTNIDCRSPGISLVTNMVQGCTASKTCLSCVPKGGACTKSTASSCCSKRCSKGRCT